MLSWDITFSAYQYVCNRYLNCFCWKALTTYLDSRISWKQVKRLASLALFYTCCLLLWAILSLIHLGIKERQYWLKTSSWQGTETISKEHLNLVGPTTPKWGKLPVMMRLYSGAGTIISWKLDFFFSSSDYRDYDFSQTLEEQGLR
jgi:hypothetical protein